MVLRSYELPSDYEDDDFQWTAADELVSGERVCAPIDEPRGSTFLSAGLVIVVGLVAGWLIVQFPDASQAVRDTASAFVAGAAQTPPPAVEPLAPHADAQPPPPVADTDVAAVPGADAGEAVAPAAPIAEPDAAAATDNDSTSTDAPDATVAAEPLPKPVADPKDPNQKRALAAGLHPDVSKALLARMTAVDYDNARDAVRTALAQTDDGDVLTWPRAGSKAGAALFEVKFVAGAAAGCRRYVVIVTLDRWSTTAPAMETCGAELPKRRVAKVG